MAGGAARKSHRAFIAGGFISGTLMEQELRDALGLADNEMVNIPKHPSADANASLNKRAT